MSDTLQQLFEAFLEANEVDYKKKSDVYTIHFEKPYSEIFEEKVTCTFNKEKASDDVQLLGPGSFMLSKIITEYSDKALLIALRAKPKHKGIVAVQDKIDELQEKEKNGHIATYKVTEEKLQLQWVTVTVDIQAAMQKEKEHLTILAHEKIQPIVNKEELVECTFEKLPKVSFEVKKAVKQAQKTVEKHLSPLLKKKEQVHEEFIKKETKLKDEHYQQLMKEANLIVDRAKDKIEETRSAALKARSFEKMYERGAEKKKEEKKLAQKEKEAEQEKKRLRKELLAEIDQIKQMKFSAKAELMALGVLEVEAFTIKYSNGKTYLFIPELHVLQ